MPEGKSKRMTLLVLSNVLGLLFLLAGGSKLVAPEMHFKDFQDWGYPIWFVFVVGVIEVVGALLLLIPLVRFYGALLLAANMLGATATHLKAGQLSRFPIPLVLCVSCLVVAYLVRVSSTKAGAAGARI
jgi:uncharacterized membrane protein YphA (DoxX/SURF4 family)